MKKRLPEKYETWKRASLFSFLFVIAWFVSGLILSNSFFDTEKLSHLKVLDKNNMLAYLAAVLAIQVPIFILFLQEMSKAGFVKRKILPRVTGFKEIIFLLLTGTTLVIFAPRESYLYFPLFVLVCVNFIAIFRAVTVTFHQEQYDNPIKKQLKSTASKSFVTMDQNRRKSNKLYEEIEDTRFIEISYFDIDSSDTTVVPIKAKSSGLLEGLDVRGVINLLTSEFKIKKTKDNELDPKQKAVPRLRLRSTPFYKVEAEDIIAEVILPSDYQNPKKMGKRMERFFKVNTKQEKLPEVRLFDEIILEFERAIDKAIRETDINLLKETFDLLRFTLVQVDEAIASDNINKTGDTYSLNDAFKELTMLINDEFSRHLLRLYEMLSDNLTKCIVEDKDELADEFIDFIYRDMLNSIEKPNLSTIARSDSSMSYAAGQFIFANSWNTSLSAKQANLREKIFFRIKEQTGLILYNLKKDSGEYDASSPIQQLFERRVTRIRDLTLASIKNKSEENFKSISAILIEIERDAKYDKLNEENELLINCTVFMLAAYIRHKGVMNTVYSNTILGLMNTWSNDELLSVLLECARKDYAGNWNIDTYDHLADGVVRSVPNYNLVMKQLWADIMLDRSFTNDPAHLGNKPKLEETLLFTNGLSDDKDNDLLNYVISLTHANKDKLVELIHNLIKLRRDWENNKLSKEPLDKSKTSKFADEVNKAFKESSISAKIFEKPKTLIIDKSKRVKGFKEFGLNQLFDKEAFITDWHSGYVTDHLAEQLGNQTAQGQDKHIFGELFKTPTKYSDMQTMIDAAKKIHSGKWIVVSNKVNNWELETVYPKNLNKKSDYQTQFLKGIRQNLEIQHIYTNDIPRGIYLVPSSNIGTLTQKRDTDIPVAVNIDAYSQNEKLLKGTLKAAPEWLKKRGDAKQQETFLKTKARLYAAYVFSYDPPKDINSVLFLPMTREM